MLASSASYPDIGAKSGAAFAWTGAACTANTYTIRPIFFPGWTVKFCRWVCAWDPVTPGSSPAAVRLVYADDGPANVTEIARFAHAHYTNPIDDAVDLTTIFRGLWTAWQANGVAYKHIGHQTAGDGQDMPLIFQSRVELFLEPSA
jgi:hypothetical protein